MKELSLHLLDIIQNSIQAEADHIVIGIQADGLENSLELRVEDNGKGMDNETLSKITSPFYTSRNTRKIGLGIPLFQASAQRCDGRLEIQSYQGKGTCLKAIYRLDHIDRPPLGDITETILSVLAANPSLTIRFYFGYRSLDNKNSSFQFDTDEVKKVLMDVPLNHPDVLYWIADYIREGIKNFAEVLNYEVTS